MISHEKGVLRNSDYYIHTASPQAQKTFFYPICLGYFIYSGDYHLKRSNYDSYLVMHIKKGQCFVCSGSQTFTAREGQVVMLDCYKPHAYYTETGWEAQWIHIDGPVARQYYQLITGSENPVMSLKDSYKFEKYMDRIYRMFKEKLSVKEALLSQYITTIMTELLVSLETSSHHERQSDLIEETVAYVNEHLAENLTLEQLAAKATLSPYYFTRLFKKETGFTPHEFLIAARVNNAKFLLKNTDTPIKEICFRTGFSNESSFCTTFKKWEGITPTSYRLQH